MRVISVTPAGRRRYLEALVPYLLAQRHVLDEHHWWLNTADAQDVQYVEQVTAEHPDFFKIIRRPHRTDLTIGQSIWRFFSDAADPEAVYLRFDDDIVYMAPDACENLVRYRLAHREPVVVLGNVVNNGVCAHFLQQAGIIPRQWGEVENFCLDGNGWACGEFARKLHAHFLDEVTAGRVDRWKLPSLPLDGRRRFSVNVVSWLGADMQQIPEVQGGIVDEELFLTVELPRRLRRTNAGCGDAVFAHLSFFTQRPYLEWTWPELIGHYQRIAQRQEPTHRWSEPALTLLRHTAWQYGRPVRKLRQSIRKRLPTRKAA